MSAAAVAGQATRWRPAPFLKASLALHIAGGLAFAIHPAAWPWIVTILAGNHLLAFAAGFVPRGRLLGPNVVRLPHSAAAHGEVALTFDDGPDPHVTPAVLDLLERYRMQATFFCVGAKVRAHPEIVKEIVRRGHAVENHSFDHPHAFAMLGLRRASQQITAAQDAIASVTGAPPRLFRPPHGFRNPWLDPLLARLGLRCVSWTRRGLDTVRSDARAVVRTLTRNLATGDILLLHDGNCGRAADGAPMVLAVLPQLLETLESRGFRSVALRTALES